MIRATVLRLCGHASTRPTAVADHSLVRISSPISPPPVRKPVALPFTSNSRVEIPPGSAPKQTNRLMGNGNPARKGQVGANYNPKGGCGRLWVAQPVHRLRRHE